MMYVMTVMKVTTVLGNFPDSGNALLKKLSAAIEAT